MSAQKRLYKVDEGKVLMGVCTGFAEYFDVDVSIVRIVFIVLLLAGVGSPILIYLIIGLVLPVKEKEIEKAETVEQDEYSYDNEDYYE